MKAGTAVSAIRRTAAMLAISAPMIAAPAFGAGITAASSAGGGSHITVQVTNKITIQGGAAAGDIEKLMRELDGQGPRLAQIIERYLEHDERRKY